MTEDTGFIIGICDDKQYIHSIIEEKLKIFARDSNMEFKYIHYFSAEELLLSEEKLDCLLLDIYVPEIGGIEAGKRLLKKKVPYKIIILSDKKEMFKECFKINTFRFVTKPIDDNELCEAIRDVYICRPGFKKEIVYKDRISYNISQMDIVFIMANKSSTIIYTASSEYRSEYTLIHWEEVLDKKIFFKCHRSYIINLGAVKKIENTYVVMSTNEKVIVSRWRKKEFISKYTGYIIKYAG
ncbi:MAG: DNA-binding response regulator [Lachnospiraceae bacterium]